MDIVNSELLSRGISILLTEASVRLTPGDGASAASHASHLRYAMHLANRAMRGENPYRDADWSGSWIVPVVDEAAWAELKTGLRTEFEMLKSALSDPAIWSSDMRVFGMIGNVAHSAWHLGALRQGPGLIETPAPKETM